MKFVFFVMVFFAMGCVSISKIETDFKAFESSNTMLGDSEVHIKFVTMEPVFCISEDQRKFLTSVAKKYFLTRSADIVIVTMRQHFANNFVISLLNAAVTLHTFTIIPMYYDSSFDFVITVNRGGAYSEDFYAYSNDRGLMSVLAIPFLYNRELINVRRNNIENAFFKSSIQGTSRHEVLSRLETYTPKICKSIISPRLRF